MKHTKNIARIVAFVLLALTMIGSFIGCKNAAGGDGSEDLTGYYVWKHYPNAEGEQVNYYAQFTKSTLQIYEVTEVDGKVSLYEERLGKRADSQDSSWKLQPIPYTAKGGVLNISATSTHIMYEDKPYTGSYDANGITIPGIFVRSEEDTVTMTKTTDNFFNRIDPNPIFTPGVYVLDYYNSSAVVLDFSETRTVQMYEIVKNETDDVVSWFPCFEPEGTFVAEKGKLTVTASTGVYEGQYSSTKVILPGKLTGTGDPSIDFVKGGDDFTKLERPETIDTGFYATQGFKEGDNIVRSYAEIKGNTIQIYKVTENEAGDIIAWAPVLGKRTGEAPNYTWTEQAAAYTAVSGKQGVFSFTASIGSWKEDKNYKIYGGKGGLATVNPYDNMENYTKAESFFDKLPSTIADGFYVTSGWKNGDGVESKHLAHFKDNTVQVYFLQEKTDGTISVSSPALGTAQDTKTYVPYTLEKGKIKFTGIYCRDDKTRKDYYGSIGLDTVSLPGAFAGSGDAFREFAKTDKDYTAYLPTEQ
ncbi:MAG: hypothetical protein IAA16_10125 [Candidatus Treponema excrementipullorum]|uniref:Lipoprotein n=1 Tax=Candidatus Treponema excrementipullorum TaxID=2838768 RepID=A0A9E2L588_9SPIR|nr:hypothetical protein [Candidatus Treponema excrementipullorum]